MISAAEPLARQKPSLEPEQPFGCPREDGAGDRFRAGPLAVAGIEEAERERLAPLVRVDVRRALACTPRVYADLVLAYPNDDERVLFASAAENIARIIQDGDRVRA